MLGISHLLISGTATSLLLGTANPTMIAVGAIAGLLPDIDISTSPAGRVLPWVSGFFESRMPHRSCTHSLVASGAIAVLGYGAALFNPQFINLVHALTIGYTFGWFADCFTRGGVEMFWPSPVRCVCPGNRNLRLRTGSNAEYFVLVLLIAIALFIFNINNSGGILTQFNRLIASPSGVARIYNESGSTHLIKANIKGVRYADRSRVNGQFYIIQSHGAGFIVLEPSTNKLYKASTETNSQIIVEEITADVGRAAITTVESIFLEDEPITSAIARFNRTGTLVFVSGQLSVDEFDTSVIPRDPYQFPSILATSSSVTLEAAPLRAVARYLGDEFATGSLQIRSIVSSS
ncbi:MAG: metal-dependent hydrolase (plasmid) [Nodularia sp. CChRGM 3473]